MAIQTVYYRLKIEGTGWRYRPLAVGRRPQAAKKRPLLYSSTRQRWEVSVA